MANKLYEETNIQAIANAIRAKNGSTDTYNVSEMAAAIQAISTGMSIPGFNIAGGTFSLVGSGHSEAARTITHGLKNSAGQAIVPNTIYVFDPNCYFTGATATGYTKSIQYDTTTGTYYRRIISKSNDSSATTGVGMLIDCSSDTTGLTVTNTSFVLPNTMYYAMHNFFWIAIGTDNSSTTTITCKGGYTST